MAGANSTGFAATPPLACEIVPAKLYAVGGVLPLDGRISWAPPTARGYQPVNSYLLIGDERPMVIDPGPACFADSVVAGLSGFLDPGVDIDVYLTRGQYDCLGNISALSAVFDVRRIFWGGQFDPLDGLGDPALLKLRSSAAATHLRPQDSRLEVIDTGLRLLNAYWGYDAETRTMFTSDAFAHAISDRPDGLRVVDSGTHDAVTLADVKDHMYAVFSWLPGSTTYAISDAVRAAFSSREVETIAPGRGRILRGDAVVRRHVKLVTAAVEAAAELLPV
jgi:flavorubredoxin